MDWSEQTARPPRYLERAPMARGPLLVAGVTALVVVFAWLSSPDMGPRDRPNLNITHLLVLKVSSAIERYCRDIGCYPRVEDGGLQTLLAPPIDAEAAKKWQGPYVESRDLKDLWEHDLVYVCPGKHHAEGFDLSSLGRDGAESDDDITNWEKAP